MDEQKVVAQKQPATTKQLSNDSQLLQPVAQRRQARRVMFTGSMLIIGFIVGVIITLLAVSLRDGDKTSVATPVISGNNAIVGQISSTFMEQVIKKQIETTGFPGTIQNVHVQLAHNRPITVTGDDTLSLLGVTVTRPFTMRIQPYIQNCQTQIHILHVDVSSIPVTDFAAVFEAQINNQLRISTSNLPGGFTYCATSVHTEAQGLFVSYSATPT